MKKTILLLPITLCVVISISCKKKEGDYIVEGKIINAGSKEPIDSVSVVLRGGDPYNPGPFMSGSKRNLPNNNYTSTYTDENGYFKLIIEDEPETFITWYKKGYKYGIPYEKEKEIYSNNDAVLFSRYGKYYITVHYVAECSFYPIFKKIENNSDNDTLRVFVRTRELGDLANIKGYSEEYIGESPFTYLNSRAYGFVGDTYVYYKLEYTDNSTWKTKIDSVYVESFETYTDTIYY